MEDFLIKTFDNLESTNKFALELAKKNQIQNKEVILAKTQSGGKGRYGRNWESPLGNLYFSLFLKLPEKNSANISNLSFVAAIALNQSIALKAQNKWPNDILINGKKVAGILLEKDLDSVVIGVGVNLISHPKDTIYPATDLKKEGLEETSPEKFLQIFLNNFNVIYRKWRDFGFVPIRNLWLEKAFRLNEKITVNLPEKKLVGIFKDLDQDGNLVLELENKEIITISSGEIFNF